MQCYATLIQLKEEKQSLLEQICMLWKARTGQCMRPCGGPPQSHNWKTWPPAQACAPGGWWVMRSSEWHVFVHLKLTWFMPCIQNVTSFIFWYQFKTTGSSANLKVIICITYSTLQKPEMLTLFCFVVLLCIEKLLHAYKTKFRSCVTIMTL